MITKISYNKADKFCKDYFSGLFLNLRLGQAFINEFFNEGQTDDRLFYTENANIAIGIIFGKYVDFENDNKE